MAKDVRWNKVLVDEFIRLGSLSELEEKVLITRAKCWTRTQQCIEFDISMSMLDRTIRSLKDKYDDVQPYSSILPPRKSSYKENYMDNN